MAYKHSDTHRRSDAADGQFSPQPEGLGLSASLRCVARRRHIACRMICLPPRALRSLHLIPAQSRFHYVRCS